MKPRNHGIIRVPALGVLVMLLAASCDSAPEAPAAEVVISPVATSQGRSMPAVRVETTATSSRAVELPPGFPAGIPMYRNASVLHVTGHLGQGPVPYVISVQAMDSIDAVNRFYRKALAGNGWQLLQERLSDEGSQGMKFTASGGDRYITVVTRDTQPVTFVIVLNGGKA